MTMTDDRAAGNVESPLSWMSRGACAGADLELFITSGEPQDDPQFEEPHYPSAEAKAYCDGCPVRVQCLAWAMSQPDLYGIWGATSAYQRSQLGRKQSRAKCPGCGSDKLIEENRHEVCLMCGLSWAGF